MLEYLKEEGRSDRMLIQAPSGNAMIESFSEVLFLMYVTVSAMARVVLSSQQVMVPTGVSMDRFFF